MESRCTDRRPSLHPFGDLPDSCNVTDLIAEVDLRNQKPHEKHPPCAIDGGRTERDIQTAKGLGELDAMALKMHRPVGMHPTDAIAFMVIGRSKMLRKVDRARLIATLRHRHAQALVRSFGVVDLAELVKRCLTPGEVGEA